MKRTPQGEQEKTSQIAAYSDPFGEDESGLSAVDLFQIILRKLWFILACTLICGLIGYIYAATSTPLYEATASIRIDPGRANSLGFSDFSGPVADTTDLVRTEIAIMESDQLAISTINSLSNQQFLTLTGKQRSGLIPLQTAEISKDQERLIAAVKSHLIIKPVTDTQLVSISFKDKNAELAAAVVNDVVDAYLKQNFESRYSSVVQVQSWLSTQMNTLKTRSDDAQQKLAQFQEQHNILGTGASAMPGGQDTSTTTTDRLRLLNEKLTTAESDRIVKEALLRSAESNDPAVLASLFPDQKFQSLQTQQANLYTQFAQLSTKFGPKYAPLVQLENQLKVVNAEIKRNTEMVRSRIREDYQTAKSSEAMLRAEYGDQVEKAYSQNRDRAQLASLEAQGSASTQLYNTLQAKLQQAGVNAGLTGVNTMRVDVARPPLTPSGTSKAATILAATVLGLMIGCASVFLIEFMSDRIQNMRQMEKATGAKAVGMIPHHTKSSQSASGQLGALVTLTDPYSQEAESYRSLRNLLFQPQQNDTTHSVLITSSAPGEGKTTVASNLAVVLAQAGLKVLLVDAEFARPSLDEAFSCSGSEGLAELLAGKPVNFVQPVPSLVKLSLLGTGSVARINPDALANQFATLLSTWAQQFDFVLVKTAPLLLVSDGMLLAKHVDGSLLIGRQDVTSLKELTEVGSLLRAMQARIAGLVLNDATVRAKAKGKHDSNETQHAR